MWTVPAAACTVAGTALAAFFILNHSENNKAYKQNQYRSHNNRSYVLFHSETS